MHLEIFSENQTEMIPTLNLFKREYYIVGGTAIALHIGHRKSIDFDMFKLNTLRKSDIFSKIQKAGFKPIVGFQDFQQLHLIVNNVKCTFFSFPYPIEAKIKVQNFARIPDLLSLAAMKAFALERRAKWKDYVDLYFIIRDFYSVEEIKDKAIELFGDEFSHKVFRMQLGYFDQMNYSEEVEFLIPNPPSNEEIKQFLIDESIRF